MHNSSQVPGCREENSLSFSWKPSSIQLALSLPPGDFNYTPASFLTLLLLSSSAQDLSFSSRGFVLVDIQSGWSPEQGSPVLISNELCVARGSASLSHMAVCIPGQASAARQTDLIPTVCASRWGFFLKGNCSGWKSSHWSSSAHFGAF